MILAYNTVNYSGLTLGYSYYSDLKNDFAKIKGVTVSPTLIPYVGLDWGLLFPTGTPFVAGKSIAKVGVGYENPISFNMSYTQDGGFSSSVAAKGNFTYQYSLIDFWTDKLSDSSWIPIYNETIPFQGA